MAVALSIEILLQQRAAALHGLIFYESASLHLCEFYIDDGGDEASLLLALACYCGNFVRRRSSWQSQDSCGNADVEA